MTALRHFTFTALALLSLSACTQSVDSTGASTSAVEPSSSDSSSTALDPSGRPRAPMMILAAVAPVGADGALLPIDPTTDTTTDGTKRPPAMIPFFVPEPKGPPGVEPKDDTKTPPACIVHRRSADDPAPPDALPPKPPGSIGDAPKMGAPSDRPDPAAPPGPAIVQIAFFADAADARPEVIGRLPEVVVECFGAPGASHVDVPRATLDDALTGLTAGSTARIALAGFPMPPPPPREGTTEKPSTPPPPPIGRGVFTLAKVTDASALDAIVAALSLPKP